MAAITLESYDYSHLIGSDLVIGDADNQSFAAYLPRAGKVVRQIALDDWGTDWLVLQLHELFEYQLGSVRELTDGNGVVQARYDYDPSGRRTKVSGDMEADFGFTGQYYHQPTGLYLALYRAYDADLGRWISRDPTVELGGLNLYGYVFNNPVNFVDLLGLDISYHGYTPQELSQVHQIAKTIQTTKRGKQLWDSMKRNHKRDFKITKDCTVNPSFDPNTDEINFDPNFTTDIQTANGLRSASPERILAHEAGHAVTGTSDDGPNNMNNVKQNENPVAIGLGQPARTEY